MNLLHKLPYDITKMVMNYHIGDMLANNVQSVTDVFILEIQDAKETPDTVFKYFTNHPIIKYLNIVLDINVKIPLLSPELRCYFTQKQLEKLDSPPIDCVGNRVINCINCHELKFPWILIAEDGGICNHCRDWTTTYYCPTCLDDFETRDNYLSN